MPAPEILHIMPLRFPAWRMVLSVSLRISLIAIFLLQPGCSVLAVADAGVTAVATTVKVGAKVVGAAVDAVLPDKDKDKEKK
jgi:hypothetical protein